MSWRFVSQSCFPVHVCTTYSGSRTFPTQSLTIDPAQDAVVDIEVGRTSNLDPVSVPGVTPNTTIRPDKRILEKAVALSGTIRGPVRTRSFNQYTSMSQYFCRIPNACVTCAYTHREIEIWYLHIIKRALLRVLKVRSRYEHPSSLQSSQ